MLECNTITLLGEKYAGPVIVTYVRWILAQALQNGIDRIYFLARDGWILKNIAEEISQKYFLPIECRYLYCSRYSLRIPTYCFIGEEAFDILFAPAMKNTILKIFERAGLDKSAQNVVLEKTKIEVAPDKLLNRTEYDYVCRELRNCNLFRSLVVERSMDAYKNTIGYFRQEGIFSDIRYAIADSGWTGSMQHSLRQLIEHEGYSKKLLGFYFGMYTPPKNILDGNFLSMYFSAKKNILRKMFFCNNLMECWLAAPHAMTRSYAFSDGRYLPVLDDGGGGENGTLVSLHVQGIKNYMASLNDEQIDPRMMKQKKEIRRIYRTLKKIMAFPSSTEAKCYGQYRFNDDITCDGFDRLAESTQVKYLKNYSIPKRVFRKLSHRGDKPLTPLFWSYGTASLAPWYKRWWYRLNLIIGEFLRAAFLK